MLLPTSAGAMMLTLALAALFWGIWANTQQADRKWRFELYALDFAIGAVLASTLLALTLGSSGSSTSFTFGENIMVGSKRNMAAAAAGGALYGVGQMMLISAVALAGMSTALPVAAALGMVVAVAAKAISGGPSQPLLAYAGAAAALAVLAAAAMAQKSAEAARPAKKGMHPGWKGLILGCVGGLFNALSLHIVESSLGGDIGLGSYGSVFFMALGLFLVFPLVGVYFLNMPVQGEPIPLKAYFRGTKSRHALGIGGGAIWVAGTLAFFSALGEPYEGAPGFLQVQATAFSGAIFGVLCGLFLWAEQAGAPKAKAILLTAAALLAAAATLLYLGA